MFADATGTPGADYAYGVRVITQCGTSVLVNEVSVEFPGPTVVGASPQPVFADAGTTVSLPSNINLQGTQSLVTEEWWKDNQPLTIGGRISVVDGRLTFNPVKIEDVARYWRVIRSPCENQIAQSVVLAVRVPCPADFNNSGGPPTVQDVFDFLTSWFAGCP